MKKTLFFFAALLTFGIASAQIAGGRIGTGNINIYGTQWSDVYGIDFDNDGTLEFRISDFEGIEGNQFRAYLSYNWTEGGNNIYADPDVPDYVGVLASGDVIDANGNWAGYGDATFSDFNSIPERIYLGFRILLADGVHYGWAEAVVSTSPTSNDVTLDWVGCAYNTVAGGAITAGQTSGSGIAVIPLTDFSVKSLGNRSLLVETANATATLYSVDGRELTTLQVAGQATLQAPTAGLYLLRVGHVTRKVMVED